MTLEHRHPRTRLGITARTPRAMPHSPNPSSLLLCANMAAPKSRSHTPLGMGLSIPGYPIAGPSWHSRTHQQHWATAPHMVQSSLKQRYHPSIPSPLPWPRWLRVRAQRRAPLAALYSAAWLRFPANPPGDTGRSREAHPALPSAGVQP